jgi:hypothetical protein
VLVTVRREDRSTVAEFERLVAQIPSVVLAQRLFGDWQGSLRRTELAGIVAGYLFAGVLEGLVAVSASVMASQRREAPWVPRCSWMVGREPVILSSCQRRRPLRGR